MPPRIPDTIKLLYEKLILILKTLLIALGIIFLLAILLSFTDYPFWAYYRLGTPNYQLVIDPEVIVIMGGGGMPSADGLIRCYYGAMLGHQYPDAKIIIAVPGDTSLHEESPELMMGKELIIRGIDSLRILFETNGFNTRTQAMNIMSMLDKEAVDTLAVRIVTSPEHMLRSVASFRKVGFNQVGGMPSFEEAIDEEMLIEEDCFKQDQTIQKHALGMRYNMWNYLKYEITVMREYTAIIYYKIRGWI